MPHVRPWSLARTPDRATPQAAAQPLNLLASPIIDYPMRAIINGLAPCLRHRFEQLLDEPWM
jgi:hypothetical protein